MSGCIRSVATEGRESLLALTFDLCQAAGQPSGYDAEIVRVLREFDVRATFFAGGLWMRSHPERALQLMADPRFEMGSHGWSHRDAARDGAVFAREALWAQSQYELLWEDLYRRAALAGLAEEMAFIPRLPLVFRFPYGSCGTDALRELAALGLPAIQWSVAPGDPDPARSAKDLSRTMIERAGAGAIVVLHANGRGRNTAEALRLALPRLRERGYRFVTVSELLLAGRPRTSAACCLLEQEDPGRYNGRLR